MDKEGGFVNRPERYEYDEKSSDEGVSYEKLANSYKEIFARSLEVIKS